MENLEKLKAMMQRRIDSLRQEAAKLSRRASAEHDYRTRRYLRELSREARNKAALFEKRLQQIDRFDLSINDGSQEGASV